MQLSKLAIVPVVALAALILLDLSFGFSEDLVFNPPYLLLALNLAFWTTATGAILYISSKSFLRDGSFTVLLVSTSVLIFAVSVTVSAYISDFSGDYAVAVSNICILVSSIIQATASVITSLGKDETPTPNRRGALAVSYGVGLLLVGIIWVLGSSGSLPHFFLASGPTLLRQVILGSAVFFFALAFLFFALQYVKSKSLSLLYYTLSIALLSMGLFSAFDVKVLGDVPTWLGRATLYIGTVYLMFAIFKSRSIASDLSTGWSETFTSNRQQSALLFSKMLNGFAYQRIIVNNEGKPVDYVFLTINDAFEKMTGLKRENVIGKKVTEVLPGIENDPADWIGVYGKVALTGQPAVLENYAESLRKWYSVSAYSPRRGYFVAIFVDITERKKMEEELRKYTLSLEKLAEERTKKLASTALYVRSLIEASLDPLVTISTEGKITDVNKATELATGCSREELIGTDFSKYFTDHQKARAGYRQVFADAFVRDYPLELKHKSGRISEVLYNAAVYRNEAGEIEGVFAAARDVTELKKAERLAEENAKKLKDVERLAAIGATAGMVGHDIRNPLQSMTSDVYLANSELASLPESEQKSNIKESLDEIGKAIDYVNKIVADLQDYARPLKPLLEETDLKELVEDLMRRNDIPKNIKFSSRVAEDAETIRADHGFLKRIMGNLVTNAVQAMPEGGKLTILAKREATGVSITVQDTGVGIPEEVSSKMFAPLFTAKSKGQGLGLAVVKRLTESMGGTVTFDSEVGKGTRFIVSLPSTSVN